MKNLMWANGSSRLRYSFFGDVVTFDTTCRTNLYDMPLRLLVGDNNNFQSIILSGVLLGDETEESFECVFSDFLWMMRGVALKTILIGQNRTTNCKKEHHVSTGVMSPKQPRKPARCKNFGLRAIGETPTPRQ